MKTNLTETSNTINVVLLLFVSIASLIAVLYKRPDTVIYIVSIYLFVVLNIRLWFKNNEPKPVLTKRQQDAIGLAEDTHHWYIRKESIGEYCHAKVLEWGKDWEAYDPLDENQLRTFMYAGKLSNREEVEEILQLYFEEISKIP